MTVQSTRIEALRTEMKAAGIDYYMFTTADYHNSEYVADFFKTNQYFSGFTGENSTLIVSEKEANLWVDGRYFIQAEKEIEGSGIILQRTGEPNVPTVHEYLKAAVPEGAVLGFDGKCITKEEGVSLARLLAGKKGKLDPTHDLAANVWTDRPQLPSHPVFLLDETKYAGETVESKLSRLRKVMAENGAGYYLSSKLDEIMWLYNIRGNDVECNPVALSYAFVTMDRQFLFIQDSEVTKEFRRYAEEKNILINHYGAIEEFLSRWNFDAPVMLDPADTSYSIYLDVLNSITAAGVPEGMSASDLIVECNSPLGYMKAVKNETELANFREVYIEDSAALTKFIYWLKNYKDKSELTEGTAAKHLDELRAGIKDYVELSFPTISAYGPNAAMMHYEPGYEGVQLDNEGMLLVDSGGHYLRGTTDVTRTMALGPVTDDMKKSYTLTAVSKLQMMQTVFIKGCCGMALDIMAREPMWRELMDYKCGTGHGIGYLLNVHEGPQTLRYRKRDAADTTPFAPGMVVSDEPGVYKAGQYGIRLETILECVDKGTSADGKFYGFAPLTFVPLDRDLIAPQYLTAETREALNAYHAEVLEKISPFLNNEEKAWLETQCAAI